MDLVPLKKNNLTRAQFEQLPDVPPEDECIRDLGHIRSFRCVLQDTYVYESAKRSDRVDQREHELSSGSKVERTAAND
jgi:hypothetical protein